MPATSGPAIVCTDTVDVDIPCAECDYNLRGLDPDAACPECGLPIRQTVPSGEFRVFTISEDIARKIAKRSALFSISISGGFLIVFLTILLLMTDSGVFVALNSSIPIWSTVIAASFGVRTTAKQIAGTVFLLGQDRCIHIQPRRPRVALRLDQVGHRRKGILRYVINAADATASIRLPHQMPGIDQVDAWLRDNGIPERARFHLGEFHVASLSVILPILTIAMLMAHHPGVTLLLTPLIIIMTGYCCNRVAIRRDMHKYERIAVMAALTIPVAVFLLLNLYLLTFP